MHQFIAHHYRRVERAVSFLGAVGIGFLLSGYSRSMGLDPTIGQAIGWALVSLMALLKLCLPADVRIRPSDA